MVPMSVPKNKECKDFARSAAGRELMLSKQILDLELLLLSSWGYVTQLLDGACPLVGCNLNIMVIFLALHISNILM